MAEVTAMSQVATQKPETPTIAGAKPQLSDDDIDRIVKQAGDGDRGCLPEVRALLAGADCGPDYQKAFGSSTDWLRQSIIRKAAGKNVVDQEAIEQELDRVGSELAEPNPTPIERLLAERASFC